MTEKTRYVGRESGKSSTRWFGGGRAGTEAGTHGHGARAGDGVTDNRAARGPIKIVFQAFVKKN